MIELVPPAVDALYACVGTIEPATVGQRRRFEFTADEPALVLRDFLAELIFLLEQDRVMAAGVVVIAYENDRLSVDAQMARVDDARSVFDREVKAVTYHDLIVREIPGGYEAIYVVDI